MLTKTSKFWLLLLILFSIVWLGGINVRFIIGHELLSFDEFNFRTNINPEAENVIFRLISYSSILIFVSYVLTFISAIFFLVTLKINYRENVWLLVCAVMFFIFSPVEFYSSFIDYKFFMVYLSKPPIHDELLEIFGKRIGLFKGLPWIAVLTYYTIIVIAVFKPLRKSIKQLEEEDKKKSEEYSYKYIMHEDDDIEEEK